MVSESVFLFNNEHKIIERTKDVQLKNPFFIPSQKDNLKIALYEFINEASSKEIIIFIPGAGFYANCLYQKMALNFQKNYKNIVLVDLRGHGNSEGERGDTPSVDHIMQDIETIIKYYQKKYLNYKIILGGHSSGAGTCINYHFTNYLKPDEYFFITPYLGNNNTNLFKKNNFIKKNRWYMYILNSITSISFLKHIKTIFFNYDYLDKNHNKLLVDSYSYEMSIATTPYDSNLINKINLPVEIILAQNDELFNNNEIIKILNNKLINLKMIGNTSHLDILLDENIYSDQKNDLINKEIIINDHLNCCIFIPKVLINQTPIICLGGSEGDRPDYWSELISKEGLITCALGYFACEKRPINLINIDLEYFKKSIEYIKEKYQTNKIILIGISRGGELALLLGSVYPELFEKIIALCPSAFINGGLPWPNLPAWKINNQPIAFMGGLYEGSQITEIEDLENAINENRIPFHQNSEKDPLKIVDLFKARYEKYKNDEEKYIIKVENIQCPLLLVSGNDDDIWPSAFYCQKIIERLNIKKTLFYKKHIDFKDVGHGVLCTWDFPIYHPLLKFWCQLGGMPEKNKGANKDCLKNIINFINMKV